jgi:hypothetical protein
MEYFEPVINYYMAKVWIDALAEQIKIDDEDKYWLENCQKCLQFAVDNSELISNNENLYADVVYTLHLLDEWSKGTQWAYIVLKKKYTPAVSAEQAGKAFRAVFDRMSEQKENEIQGKLYDIGIDVKDKSLDDVIEQLSNKWNEM